MRYNLVTTFRCATCGSQLRLTYDKPKCTPYQPEANDEITGAAKVENIIYLEPCQICVDEYRTPINALKNALGVMKGGA